MPAITQQFQKDKLKGRLQLTLFDASKVSDEDLARLGPNKWLNDYILELGLQLVEYTTFSITFDDISTSELGLPSRIVPLTRSTSLIPHCARLCECAYSTEYHPTHCLRQIEIE
jgi:hypothetical protein